MPLSQMTVNAGCLFKTHRLSGNATGPTIGSRRALGSTGQTHSHFPCQTLSHTLALRNPCSISSSRYSIVAWEALSASKKAMRWHMAMSSLPYDLGSGAPRHATKIAEVCRLG